MGTPTAQTHGIGAGKELQDHQTQHPTPNLREKAPAAPQELHCPKQPRAPGTRRDEICSSRTQNHRRNWASKGPSGDPSGQPLPGQPLPNASGIPAREIPEKSTCSFSAGQQESSSQRSAGAGAGHKLCWGLGFFRDSSDSKHAMEHLGHSRGEAERHNINSDRKSVV